MKIDRMLTIIVMLLNRSRISAKELAEKFESLSEFVPNVEEVSLDCGHWIQQEKPEETTRAILKWLKQWTM